MGAIVNLALDAARRRDRSQSIGTSTTDAKARSADIVIFPGVRYERVTETAASGFRLRRPHQRDRLVLID